MIKIGKGSCFYPYLLLVVLFFSSIGFADSKVKVEAKLEDDTVLVGNPFVFTVSISTDGNVETQDPDFPEVEGLALMGTSTSASFTSRLMPGPNGMVFEKARVLSYNYNLVARTAGTYTLGPVQVVVEGNPYTTKPIQLEVTDDPRRVAPKINPRAFNPFNQSPGVNLPDEEDDVFGQLLQRRARPKEEPAYKTLPKNPNEAFFVTVELDKTEAYAGEQVFANWYLYTRGEITQLDRLKFPDLRGFWKEDIEPAPNLLFQQEIVNGVPFKKALLASHALFPIKEGVSVVDEYKIRATVSLPTMAYGLAYGKPFQYTRSSDRVKVKIKPLPTENMPKDFSGAVGSYQISANIENKVAQVGQVIPLKIRFEGEGNAKLIDTPILDLPPSLELYDSKSEAKYFKSGKSYKEFEIFLMPKQEGDLEIPAFTFSFFDPNQKEYIQAKTEPISIKVMPGVMPQGQDSRMKVGSVAAPVKQALPSLIKSYHSSFAPLAQRMQLWIGIYLAVLVILLGRAAVAFEFFKKDLSLKDQLKDRQKRIYQLLKKGHLRQVGAESINTMNLVLGSLSELGGASQDLNRIIAALSPSLRRELGEELKSLGEVFQTLCFAPDEMLGDLKNQKFVEDKIKQLEKALNKSIDLSNEGLKE